MTPEGSQHIARRASTHDVRVRPRRVSQQVFRSAWTHASPKYTIVSFSNLRRVSVLGALGVMGEYRRVLSFLRRPCGGLMKNEE